MTKKTTLITLLFIAQLTLGQTSKVFDRLSMSSKILNMERKYAVYLPPNYDTSDTYYPVLYLLHGSGDDQTGWVQFGEVQRIADKAIADGTATAMIIIMPDANTGKRGYFNDINNDWRYEDFFFQELLPTVEKKYRIKTEKHYRAIAGLSMGGGGSFFYAMHHTELFSSACPLSAYVPSPTYDDFVLDLNKNNTIIKDQSTVKPYFENHTALSLLEKTKVEDIKTVKWFFDCGDDDFLYEGNSLLHIAMRKKDIPHEFRIRDGAHNWTYWRDSLPVVLSFVTESFHQK